MKISEEAMLASVMTVFDSRILDERKDGVTPPSDGTWRDLASCRMQDFGVDSLFMAEIIVVLEQRLNMLLELTTGTRLATFGDLRAALSPVGQP